MKKLFLAVFTSFFFAHVGLSETYVWEDYDDFSGSSLDTNKWGTKYLGGGIEPYVSGGKLILSGNAGNPSATKVVKAGWEDIFDGDDGGQAWVYPRDSDIVGIEAEFLIPSFTSSMSGLALGVASLSPLSYATAELNAEPNSASQYSQGFGFYHLANGSEVENFGTTQRDTTHRLGATLIDGIIKLYVDGEIRYEAGAGTFNTDMFYINGFNDYQSQGLAFELTADNARVLRRVTTTNLDGSVILITSEDPVKETLVFENGVITSTFENPVDNEHNVQSGISYTLDEGSDASYKITLSDGDFYTFNPTTGMGSLTDYSNGQIDESGSWNFSFERFDWEDYDDFSDSSLDSSKWISSNSYFSGNEPTETGGYINLSGLTSLNTEKNTFLILKNLEGIIGVEADIWLPSDAPNDTGVMIGIADGGTPVGYLDLWGSGDDSKLYVYLENSVSGESVDFTRNAELGITYRVGIIKENDRSALFLNGEKVAEVVTWQSENLNILFRGVNDADSPFTAYLDNVRVLRRSLETQGYAPDSIAGKAFIYTEGSESEVTTFSSDGKVYGDKDGEWTFYTYEKLSANVGKIIYTFENEENPMPEEEILTFTSENAGTFEWSEYSDSYMSTKVDQGNGTFSMSDTSEEPAPVTVVSDPSGNPVVLQIGQDYQWNDSLDGVMLWGVWQDDDTNEWVIATVNYIGGRQKGAKGSYSSLPADLDVDHPYTINGDTIDVTETSGHQYYQVTSVDNDTIYAVDGDGIPLTDPSWWFVTKSAAEEFYNSKINYAPESLGGLTVKIHSIETSPTNQDYGIDTKYFVSQQVYSWEENQLESTTFSYLKNSAGSATLTIYHDGGATKTIHELIFSSENSAIGTWTEEEEAVTYAGTTTFTIIDEEYAPDSLVGWKLDAGASTYKFTGDSSGVFYHVDEGNYSNSELSNITYTWEKAGPGIGKLHTSLDKFTWMFFEDNTTGLYDWEEQEHDNGGSGNFSLNYYPDGHAHESMTGNSLKLGDITYVFTSDTSVTVTEGNASTVLEYAYLKNGSNNGILSLNPENRDAIMDLTFYSSGYGRVDRGGSGYFQILSNWATKGWIWQDHYPWAYSNNMEDWYYQVLFINDDNESDMAHYQVWNNQWNIPGELHYSGESNFSSADAYFWEDYDEFNGSELNITKWDVAWWDGGTAPSIDQLNNQVVFNKGSSYEANLSDLMNVPNPNAESEYSRGYSSTTGNAPTSLGDLVVFIAETAVYSDGTTDYYGEDEIYFSETHRSRWDSDENSIVTDPYTYTKTGSDTATLTINKSGATYTAEITFISPTEGTGNWTDYENGETESGTLTFKVEYSPHSLLEFVQSDDIKGIEFELMIPDGAPDQTCIGLFAVDYNAMFNATSDEQEEQAMRFDLDLCYFGGTLTSEFNFKDQTTGQEISEKRSSTLGNFQKFQFYFADGKIYFSLPGEEAKEYNFDRANETFVIRAQNEQNLDFSVYLRNVRVLRKKSYPQGWMWMDYYPWAYSHESNSWLYFQLAKDTDGQPGMIYWDTATKDWDIYYPSLSPEQVEDQENAASLLNQE